MSSKLLVFLKFRKHQPKGCSVFSLGKKYNNELPATTVSQTLTTLVAMIRGINVGGNAMVKMQDLRKMFEDEGYQNVCTYLQSGNVVFESTAKSEGLGETIGMAFENKIGFRPGVFVRSEGELEKILKKNPYAKKDPAMLHVTFLSEGVKSPDLTAIDAGKSAGESYSIVEREIYLFLPNGYGRTKLSNNFFEKKLKVGATTRNWKTVNALATLAKSG